MRHNGRQRIFVFGSNLAGKHSRGAALTALKAFGAKYGQAHGLQGFSYAIPTKGKDLRPLSLQYIEDCVADLMAFVVHCPEFYFEITRIGCGPEGFDWEKDIRPMFPTALPENCVFIHLPSFSMEDV